MKRNRCRWTWTSTNRTSIVTRNVPIFASGQTCFVGATKEIGGQPIGGVVRYDSSFGDETDLGVIPSATNGYPLDMRAEIQTIINTSTAGVATPVFAVTTSRNCPTAPQPILANHYQRPNVVRIGSWGTTLAHINLREQRVASCRQPRQPSTRWRRGHCRKMGKFIWTSRSLDCTRQRIVHILFTGGTHAHAVDLRSARYGNDNNPASIVSSTFTATNSSTRLGSNTY